MAVLQFKAGNVVNFVKNQYFRHNGGFSSFHLKRNPFEPSYVLLLSLQNGLSKQIPHKTYIYVVSLFVVVTSLK